MDFIERNLGSVRSDSNVPRVICRNRRPIPDSTLAARYDAAAPRWHRRMRWLGYPEAYARLFAHLQAAARLRSLAAGGRVLDCGIGTGVLSLALACVAPSKRSSASISLRPCCAKRRRTLLPPGSRPICAAVMLSGYRTPRRPSMPSSRRICWSTWRGRRRRSTRWSASCDPVRRSSSSPRGAISRTN